jgi:hypothetical protein
MNDTAIDYQKLLTETLQKQMVILGSAITLAKARHVTGLHISDDGRVTGIDGNPQEVSIKLLEQFRELSPLMVKKTMKPLLNAIISSYPKTSPAPEQTDVHAASDAKEAEDKEVNAPSDTKPAESAAPHSEEKHEEKHEETPAQSAPATVH